MPVPAFAKAGRTGKSGLFNDGKTQNPFHRCEKRTDTDRKMRGKRYGSGKKANIFVFFISFTAMPLRVSPVFADIIQSVPFPGLPPRAIFGYGKDGMVSFMTTV